MAENERDSARLDLLVDRVLDVRQQSKFLMAVPDRAVCLLLLDIRDNLDRLVMFHTGGVPAHHEGDHFRVLEERQANAEKNPPSVADHGVNP